MRRLLTAVAWIASVVVLAPVCFFVIIVFAGPHSSILASVIQPIVFVLGWALFLIAPLLIARAGWRRTGSSTKRDTY